MRCFIGIDLGSTTTKAVLMDENMKILGRGITGSRSNYDIAAAVTKQEAKIGTRFTLFRDKLASNGKAQEAEHLIADLERTFRLEQFLYMLSELEATCDGFVSGPRVAGKESVIRQSLDSVFKSLRHEALDIYGPEASRKSDFFRDIAGSRYMALAEGVAKQADLNFDLLVNIYDKSINEIENRMSSDDDVSKWFVKALDRVLAGGSTLDKGNVSSAMNETLSIPLDETYVVGTGYGRVRLPFPKEHIRSEILCHGLGAHMMYPGTRTVLDIGGQDTKGIQVDDQGIVENFQMNDRCAAGC
ncbi:MAG: benzoyl-CoA reductase subunit A, partial [Rhodospirillales bacterium]